MFELTITPLQLIQLNQMIEDGRIVEVEEDECIDPAGGAHLPGEDPAEMYE